MNEIRRLAIMKDCIGRMTVFAVCSVVLSACGGGIDSADGTAAPSGSSAAAARLSVAVTAPVAPVPTLTYRIKQLHFTWPAVAGATYYQLFENPDGTSGFTQVGANLTTTIANVNIALYRRVNARYIVAACNGAGCTNSAPISLANHLVAAIGYLKASNTDAGDQFGYSVALSADGTTLAVGARSESSASGGINGNQSDNNMPEAGAVYVFARIGGVWQQQAYIKAPDPGLADSFGNSVSLSANGNKLAVGAPLKSNSYGLLGTYLSAGRTYVFLRSNGTWTQQQVIFPPEDGANQQFGYSVSLSGDGMTLAVGEPYGNWYDIAHATAGVVYVFAQTSGLWNYQAHLQASNPDNSDSFGGFVSLSNDGNTLAVGAWGESSNATGVNGNQLDNSAPNSGAAYVFTRASGVWSQQAYIKASNTNARDGFSSVSLSGDGMTLAVGASGESSNATGINGNQSNNTVYDAGAVYVFVRAGNAWSQQAYIKPSYIATSVEAFGFSVSLSNDGNTLAVGAQGESSIATGVNGNQATSPSAYGAVYVFSRQGSAWSQLAYVKASNTDSGDWFGRAVSLSADANTLAVGAIGEASGAIGIGGNQADNSARGAGAVYLY